MKDTGRFRANDINVIEIHREIDLKVALAEVRYSIDRILKDIEENFGDAAWKVDASFSLKELEHKGHLIAMKLEAKAIKKLEEEAEKKGRKDRFTEEITAAYRFRDAAKILLTPDTFEKIKALVRLQGASADIKKESE